MKDLNQKSGHYEKMTGEKISIIESANLPDSFFNFNCVNTNVNIKTGEK